MTTTIETPTLVELRPGSTADLEAMEAFLLGLSPDTSYRRFLTGFGPRTPPGLARRLLRPGATGASLLAWRGGVVAGHGMWAPVQSVHDQAATPSTVEIGVVVADAWQGSGIGSLLVDGLALDITRHGFPRVQAVINAENQVVRRMVAGRAPGAEYARDGAEITVSVSANALEVSRRSPR